MIYAYNRVQTAYVKIVAVTHRRSSRDYRNPKVIPKTVRTETIQISRVRRAAKRRMVDGLSAVYSAHYCSVVRDACRRPFTRRCYNNNAGWYIHKANWFPATVGRRLFFGRFLSIIIVFFLSALVRVRKKNNNNRRETDPRE